MQKNVFSFESIEDQYRTAVEFGYEICTCMAYVAHKKEGAINKLIVNRVDVDFSINKAEKLCDIFDKLGVKGSFFIRLHAKEYNPFSFENYRIIKKIIASGHELGYHSEVMDQSSIWEELPEACLRKDISIINQMFGISISGVASHGGLTGLNNLDFWKDRSPKDFGLLYEAYDKCPDFNLFADSFYISDSEWTQWKCYKYGQLQVSDRKTFGEHVMDGHNLIYLLIHSDTYFDRHFYE